MDEAEKRHVVREIRNACYQAAADLQADLSKFMIERDCPYKVRVSIDIEPMSN